jgi:hypothetical protein
LSLAIFIHPDEDATSLEVLEHLALGLAVLLALVLEEDVVLIGEEDEKMSLPAGLSLAGRERLGLHADTGRVRREAEGGLLRLLRHRVDDASEGGS